MPRIYSGALIYVGPELKEIDLKPWKLYENCVATELTSSGRIRVKVSDGGTRPRYLTLDSKLVFAETFKPANKAVPRLLATD
jgi:hypothetical protein